MRDAYLEPFTVYAAHRDLVRLVDRARQAGRVTRALAWRAALVAEPPEAHAEWDFPVRGWLEEILHDCHLTLRSWTGSGRRACAVAGHLMELAGGDHPGDAGGVVHQRAEAGRARDRVRSSRTAPASWRASGARPR